MKIYCILQKNNSDPVKNLKIFFGFFQKYCILQCFISIPSKSALSVRRSNHSARSHKIVNILDGTVCQAKLSPVFSRILTLSNRKISGVLTNPALCICIVPVHFIRVLWIRIRSDPHNFDGSGSGSASRSCRSGSGGFGSVTISIQPLLQKISTYCPKY
jgi:hypothetical protein